MSRSTKTRAHHARAREPSARSETVRQALRAALRDGVLSARELSGQVSITEKDVVTHLEHLERSLQREAERLRIEPAVCLG